MIVSVLRGSRPIVAIRIVVCAKGERCRALERLSDGHGDVAVCGWSLPDSMLLPTGELARSSRGSVAEESSR